MILPYNSLSPRGQITHDTTEPYPTRVLTSSPTSPDPKMVAFTQIVYTAALLVATTTAAAIAIPPYPLTNTTQLTANTTRLTSNTTFLTSTTTAVAPPELASGVSHGSVGAMQLVWPSNSLGPSDCIFSEDDRCDCCRPHYIPDYPLFHFPSSQTHCVSRIHVVLVR